MNERFTGAVDKYLDALVGRIFKILPMYEKNEDVRTYVCGIVDELIGFGDLIDVLDGDPKFISLLALLKFVSENSTSDGAAIRATVFKSITLCNKLRADYCRCDGGTK